MRGLAFFERRKKEPRAPAFFRVKAEWSSGGQKERRAAFRALAALGIPREPLKCFAENLNQGFSRNARNAYVLRAFRHNLMSQVKGETL